MELSERERVLQTSPDFLRLSAEEREAFNTQLDRIRTDGWVYQSGTRVQVLLSKKRRHDDSTAVHRREFRLHHEPTKTSTTRERVNTYLKFLMPSF